MHTASDSQFVIEDADAYLAAIQRVCYISSLFLRLILLISVPADFFSCGAAIRMAVSGRHDELMATCSTVDSFPGPSIPIIVNPTGYYSCVALLSVHQLLRTDRQQGPQIHYSLWP